MNSLTVSSKGPSTNLLSASKKIKKSRGKTTIYDSGSASPSSSASGEKKYQTFDNNNRSLILMDLKKELIKYFSLDISEEMMSADHLLCRINQISLDDYNDRLGRILTQRVKNFDGETKTLTTWRKKIKGWVSSSEKPETRGGLVVAHNNAGDFNKRIFEVLEGLEFRSFESLQKKVIEVLREFHELKKKKDPFNDKTCSKHWWFNFCKKNVDIGMKWKSIPLERSAKKNSKEKINCRSSKQNKKDKEDSDSASSVETSMDIEDSQFAGLEISNESNHAFPSPVKDFQIPFEYDPMEIEQSYGYGEAKFTQAQESSSDLIQEPFSPSRFLASDEKVDIFREDEDELRFGHNSSFSLLGRSEDKFPYPISFYRN